MKKTTVAAVIMALIATTFFSTSFAFAEAGISIGVSLPTQREERWVRDAEQLQAEAKKLGIDMKLQISDNDAIKQVAQCENLFAQNITVLIIAPHDADGAAAIVEKAHKA
jgi:D-xylose transport system substrate-binding protein